MANKKIQRALNRRVVYIGPTLNRGLLKSGTVFLDGEFPKPIDDLRSKSPALRGLFVPVEELSVARQRVQNKGDLLNAFVARLNKELKER